MANYYSEYATAIKQLTAEEEAWFNAMLSIDARTGDLKIIGIHIADGVDPGDDVGMWAIEDDAELGGRYIKFADVEGDSNAHAVLQHLFRDFLKKFRPDSFIMHTWSYTCDKMNLDGFGGGATLITADETVEVNTTDWMSEQVSKLDLKDKDCANK